MGNGEGLWFGRVGLLSHRVSGEGWGAGGFISVEFCRIKNVMDSIPLWQDDSPA